MAKTFISAAEFSGAVTFGSSVILGAHPGLAQPDDLIVAHSGGTQGAAVQLTESSNVIGECAAHLDSVVLPNPSAAGQVIKVTNNGDYNVAVYPYSGDSIDSRAANAYFPIHTHSSQVFVSSSSSNWYTMTKTMRWVHSEDLTNIYSQLAWDATPVYTELDVSAIIPPSAYGNGTGFFSVIYDTDGLPPGGIRYLMILPYGSDGDPNLYIRWQHYCATVDYLGYGAEGIVSGDLNGVFESLAYSYTDAPPDDNPESTLYVKGYYVIG